MKLEYYSFCTSSGVKIDDEFALNAPRETVLLAINEVCNKLSQEHLIELLKDIIELHSVDSEDLGECEQCGDYSYIRRLDTSILIASAIQQGQIPDEF